MLNPIAGEPVYEYNGAGAGTRGCHNIVAAEFTRHGITANHIQIEGRDPVTGEPLIASVFDWESIRKEGEKPFRVVDNRLNSLHNAYGYGEMLHRGFQARVQDGSMRVRVNVGQEPGDIISIHDPATGQYGTPWRVVGIETIYQPIRGVFEQVIELEGV